MSWGKKVSFEKIKVGEQILVISHEGFRSESHYLLGDVTKVTGARFTVSFNGREQVFTKKDGREYPTDRGYRSRWVELHPLTDEGVELIKRSGLARKIGRIASELHDALSNGNVRAKLNSSVSGELETTLNTLKGALENVNKYKELAEKDSIK